MVETKRGSPVKKGRHDREALGVKLNDDVVAAESRLSIDWRIVSALDRNDEATQIVAPPQKVDHRTAKIDTEGGQK